MYKTIELIVTGRDIADCHGNNGGGIGNIVKVIPSVRPLSNIRCKQRHSAIVVTGILLSAVDDTFTPPVRKVADRC